MKPYEPYPMMIRFKSHQGLSKGDLITENVGGQLIHFKVISIRSFKTILIDGQEMQEVILMVREIPGGDQDDSK